MEGEENKLLDAIEEMLVSQIGTATPTSPTAAECLKLAKTVAELRLSATKKAEKKAESDRMIWISVLIGVVLPIVVLAAGVIVMIMTPNDVYQHWPLQFWLASLAVTTAVASYSLVVLFKDE